MKTAALLRKEHIREKLEIDMSDLTYEADVLRDYMASSIALLQGTPLVAKGPSKLSSALTAGASTAIAAGTAASPLGAGPAIVLASLGALQVSQAD
jgi:hypothetical protein